MCDVRRTGMFVIGCWRGAAAVRDRGGKSVGVGRNAGGGAVGRC